jgi:predicted metal-dependent phosphoesterase TrpH
MRFELHCHSHHSKRKNIPWEGLSSPKEMARHMHRKGIGGFAITDHDSTASWKEAKAEAKKLGMVFIPASEITTESGHLIGLGITGAVKPGLAVEESIEMIHNQGGIAVAPHPLDIRSEGIGRENLRLADAAETFNSMNLTRIENALAAREADRIGMPRVGGSDAHSLDMLGTTVNHIDADSVDSALRKIKAGAVRYEGGYIPMPVFVDWIRRRMILSRKEIEAYIQRNYRAPKAAVARFMLKRFVNNEWRAWNALGYFAVGLSTFYSYARFVTS